MRTSGAPLRLLNWIPASECLRGLCGGSIVGRRRAVDLLLLRLLIVRCRSEGASRAHRDSLLPRPAARAAKRALAESAARWTRESGLRDGHAADRHRRTASADRLRLITGVGSVRLHGRCERVAHLPLHMHDHRTAGLLLLLRLHHHGRLLLPPDRRDRLLRVHDGRLLLVSNRDASRVDSRNDLSADGDDGGVLRHGCTVAQMIESKIDDACGHQNRNAEEYAEHDADDHACTRRRNKEIQRWE